MSGKVSSAADSHIAMLCPVCQAVPMDKTDQFCRRCGCRLNLSCRFCNANISCSKKEERRIEEETSDKTYRRHRIDRGSPL
ncbi:hypothetical protein Y032_0605g567 [Ancylostoma ceylanicum]|uniref:Uncharacterized protein n=1 Tax=Ancylostoma ceylanicum TaxID=53326 RepID=A0A016WMW6_9BILA|nr:hypothetical protein Y032_0605g567 [Ancylostoma ceylanicum]